LATNKNKIKENLMNSDCLSNFGNIWNKETVSLTLDQVLNIK